MPVEEKERMQEPKRMEDTKKAKPSKSIEQSSYNFTGTVAARTGPARVSPGPLGIYSSFQLSVFMGFLSVGTKWSSDACAFS